MSKNNRLEMWRKQQNTTKHYAIKRLSVGVVSVAVAATISLKGSDQVLTKVLAAQVDDQTSVPTLNNGQPAPDFDTAIADADVQLPEEDTTAEGTPSEELSAGEDSIKQIEQPTTETPSEQPAEVPTQGPEVDFPQQIRNSEAETTDPAPQLAPIEDQGVVTPDQNDSEKASLAGETDSESIASPAPATSEEKNRTSSVQPQAAFYSADDGAGQTAFYAVGDQSSLPTTIQENVNVWTNLRTKLPRQRLGTVQQRVPLKIRNFER